MNTLLWPQAPLAINQAANTFLAHAQTLGVVIRVSDRDAIAYPNPEAPDVSGYFQDRPVPTLGVALGGDWTDTFPVFLHEYAHLTQWAEGIALWTDLFRDGVEANDWMDRWLAGEDLPAEQVAWMFRAVRAIEMDCERRALALIERLNLPLDPVVYARKANAYVLFYHHAQRDRSWRPADAAPPYRIPAIWQVAPATLGDAETLPAPLSAAYDAVYHA